MASTATSRIEGVTASLAVKVPCRAATTGSITLSGLQTIDTVDLASGDRVLVHQQADPRTNGIYVADTGAWTRARDFDGPRDVTKGTMVFVTDGFVYEAIFFTLDTATPVEIGTDALTFTARSQVTGDVVAVDIAYDNTASGLAADDTQVALDEVAAKFLGAQGTSIASAATTDIGAANSDFVRITGTTTITSLGASTGRNHVWIKFTGILTLTHNAASLILPGGADILTAAGDIAEFVRLSGANWQCISYHRASGLPVNKATQAQAAAGTDDATVMTPLAVAQAIAVQAEAAPVGAIIGFAASTPPPGWLECAGQLLTITTYPDLHAVIGATYNVGGEAGTQFRLPDLRGEFLRGWDNGRGVDASRAFGSAQADAFQGHRHGVLRDNQFTSGTSRTGLVAGGSSGDTGDPTTDGTNGTPRVAAETRPRNVAVLFCIRAFGGVTDDALIDLTSLAADVAQIATHGFTESFVSAEQTITAAGLLTLAHGMTETPRLIQASLVCKTAEYGYSVGDEVIVNPSYSGNSTNRGMSIIPSSTDIRVRFGLEASSMIIINAGTGNSHSITNANWRLIMKAWA